jgi:hypothetical protein
MLAGLLSDEARALYDRLVDAGGLPAGVLPEQALAELSSHGLVWESAEPSRGVRAVSQPVALRRLLGRRQQEIAEAQRRLADDYSWLERQVAIGAAPASSGVDVVRGSGDVLAVQHDLIAAARDECRVVWADPRSGWWVPPATATVPMRMICAPSVLERPAFRAEMGRPDGPKSAYRLLPDPAIRMVLVDDTALMPVEAGQQAALVIREPALVEALSEFFALLWRSAVPVAGVPAPDDAPAPVQLEILRLAGMGLKDDAIARSLGRSSRWVRRHFEVLEQMLGATNRLTLGIAAARRGWV